MHTSSPAHTLTRSLVIAEPPAPPPPPYGGARTMLPPTSPQNHQPLYNGQSTPSRPSIPLPPSFSGPRDLPALPASRPESSMSISSMLGSDVGQPTKDNSTVQRNGVAASVNGQFSTPAHTANTLSSPTRRVFGPAPLRRRTPSPVGHERQHETVNRPFRAFSNDTQRHTPSNVGPSSPKAVRPTSSVGQAIVQRSPTVEPGSGQQWRFSHHRQSSGNTPGKRPSSQPSNNGTTSQAPGSIRHPRPAISISDRYRDLQVAQKYDQLAQEAKQRFNYGPAERPSQEFLETHIRKVREERAAMAAANRKSPKPNHAIPRPSVTTDLANSRFRQDIDNVDHVYNHNPQDMPLATQSPFSPDYLRRSREERLPTSEPQPPLLSQSNSSQSRYSERPEERHKQHGPLAHQIPMANLNRSVSTTGIEQTSKGGDDVQSVQQPRHSLSLLIESGKRGRVSPLPQAVQGAQARTSGPASDPGIKNEFGRMFSGIGSGVGSSGPMGSGTSTPFPASPKGNHEPERRTPFASRGELLDLTRPREGSRLGRRTLGRDEESRMESENGVGTPGGRVVRKRHGHHHHLHNHR